MSIVFAPQMLAGALPIPGGPAPTGHNSLNLAAGGHLPARRAHA